MKIETTDDLQAIIETQNRTIKAQTEAIATQDLAILGQYKALATQNSAILGLGALVEAMDKSIKAMDLTVKAFAVLVDSHHGILIANGLMPSAPTPLPPSQVN
jgi:hypothetical protein